MLALANMHMNILRGIEPGTPKLTNGSIVNSLRRIPRNMAGTNYSEKHAKTSPLGEIFQNVTCGRRSPACARGGGAVHSPTRADLEWGNIPCAERR